MYDGKKQDVDCRIGNQNENLFCDKVLFFYAPHLYIRAPPKPYLILSSCLL